MKSVLISINPKWCELIASGKKTVEVRKSKPKLETPFKCYIYETQGRTETPFIDEEGHHIFKGRGQVIGEFVCRGIMQPYISLSHMAKESCLTEQELIEYSNGKTLYGWRITDLVIYDKPRELSEFYTLDDEAVQNCNHRVQSYFDGYCNSGCLKCGFYCSQKDDWCDKCKTKPIKRPPQSWCYVEELNDAE